MTYEISQKDWHTCNICKQNIKNLAKIYGGSNIYFNEVFESHLKKEHNITSTEYFSSILEAPKCECGVCGKPRKISKRGARFFWKRFSCGLNNGVKKWSEEAKLTRKGSGNPMYGKTPWNLNGSFSKETKEKMRSSALARIERGDFKFTLTKPHKIVCGLLEKLNVSYKNEKVLDNFAFDIYLNDFNTLIEIDGDYFHCNPKFYPNGPINNIQKTKINNDKLRNSYCLENNIKLIRFWEYDIIHNIKDVECTLKELLQLKKSEECQL